MLNLPHSKVIKLTGVKSGISTLSSLVWLMVLLEAGELSLVCPGRPLLEGVDGSMFSVYWVTFKRSRWGGSKLVPTKKSALLDTDYIYKLFSF